MNNTWIFYDKENNLWKFQLKKNGDLIYSIMYSECRWTNENKIDTDVLEFEVEVDKEENIHIIYSKKGKLKYCIWNKEQWLGKVLYKFDDNNEIREVTLVMIEDNINAFFILKNIKNSSVGTLMHYIWGEDNATINTIQEIMLISNVERHYYVEVINKNDIYVFFINNKGSEIEVKNFVYENLKWSLPKKLYDIKGSKISFCTILSKNKIHILNLSKEKDIYSLEAVYLDFNGEMQYDKLFEGRKEIINPILVEKDNVLWAMWREEENIISASFEDQWKPSFRLYTKEEKDIVLYNCIFGYDGKKIRGNKLLGTNSDPIKFFLPSNPLRNEKKSEKLISDINEEKESDPLELKEFKELEGILYSLKLQLKQKENIVSQLEEQLSNVIFKNKKLQEKCNVFKQIYEESQGGLKERKEQLDTLQKKLDGIVYENEHLSLEIEELKKEKQKMQDILNEENLKNKQISKEIELKISEKEELEQNLEKIIIENRSIKEEFQNTIKEKKELEENLEEMIIENRNIKEEIQDIIKEKEEFQHTLEIIKKQLNVVIKEKEETALMLKEINNEKIKLQRDLEEEMNKSIISKILGRRDDI